VVSEEKSKKRPGPGGMKVGEPRDISGKIEYGALDKVKRSGKPIPSGYTTPSEVKKAVNKGGE